MKKAVITGGILAIALVVVVLALALAVGPRRLRRGGTRSAAPPPAISPRVASAAKESWQGFLFGRVTTLGGATYVGRLRWGDEEEAFWNDTFNGYKGKNPWVAHVAPGRLPLERRPIEIFGLEIASRERPASLGRPFMALFGDIARIEASGGVVRVTLKSGSAFDLERDSSSDFDDDLRVWDGARGAVSLDSRLIRTIEFLPTAPLGAVPARLQGTVRTGRGDFTGTLQWDREKGVGTDTLRGRTANGEVGVRFDTIRSIARSGRDGSRVTLLDGRELVLGGTRDVGPDNRGIYVDDGRTGRVLVPWDLFERVDFVPGDSGPAYGDFPPGRPLAGSVAVRGGRRLAGRLVFDLDESETTETLDAPSRGVNYSIPLGLVVSLLLPPVAERAARPALVTLRSGRELQLECIGDLGEGNAGLLVFVEGRPRPEYVPWSDVEEIRFDGPRE